ncbi:MAG: hypothetical protein H0T17_07335 [Propionibacteriales bacterium]|nr:hypothetical protein [Propionibacteriales bacterium]
MDEPLGGGSSEQTLLVVAGSGRSGTSLLTGLTGRLGLYIPQPELKPNESNPRGFGEPKWALGFHKELLRSVDVTHDDGRPEAWDKTARVANRRQVQERLRLWLEDQFAHSDRIVVKDPRLAWFVKLYGNVANDLSAQLCIVTMLRHPAETVMSKQLAYGSRVDSTTRMTGWLNMMLWTEYHTRQLPRAIVLYDHLLDDWKAALATAERQLPLDLVSSATSEQLADADGLVDVSLRRTDSDWAELDLPAPLHQLAERAYEALATLAGDGSQMQSAEADLDSVRDDFVAYFHEAEALVRSSLNAARAAERRKLQKMHKAELKEAVVKARRESRPVLATPEPSLVARVRRGAGRVMRKVRA